MASPTTATVVLVSAGTSRGGTMHALREIIPGLSPFAARDFLAGLPKVVWEGDDPDQERHCAGLLTSAGAEFRVDRPEVVDEPEQRETFGEPLDIQAFEAENLEEMREAGVEPLLPFGDRNDDWERLKAAMQPGDEIRAFSSPPKTWEMLCGRSGYAVVRNGEIVEAMVTEMN